MQARHSLGKQSCALLIGCLLLAVSTGNTSVAQASAGLEGQWVAFSRAGGPNSDLQCFTPANVTVSGGNLLLLTKQETATCTSIDLPTAPYRYTSGFVAMRSFNFLYGTVEFRAKFGGGMGSGAWPVVWMADASCQPSDPTGTDDRCNGQEIDIAEILDGNFNHVNEQIHVNNFTYNDACQASVTDTNQNFHVYRLVWSPGSLVFSIDGKTTCTIARPYVPNAAMYVKMNVFVGDYGGPVKNGSLPWTTIIDYVRVTQGSKVVFNDDFNLATTIQSGPAGKRDSLWILGYLQGKLRRRRVWAGLPALMAIGIVLGVAIRRRQAAI
jgi:beta-glucanase (GH16 family)